MPCKKTGEQTNNVQMAYLILFVTVIFGGLLSCQGPAPGEGSLPNFIVIFCDDLGYGDIGCFGAQVQRTPNIDRMASEGIRLTSFYSTSGVCTPSRSSLMTGCYPRRVNLHEDELGRWVLYPSAQRGLHPDEVTIAEILKDRGYATAVIGKWHLGDQLEFLPTRQGFDSYFGIPYSNDMVSSHPKHNFPPLPLLRNEEVIETKPDQALLTKRYTQEAVEFVRQNKDQPFFLYLAHTMPHNPVAASESFLGKSENGTYGDAVEEIDWSTGELLNTLNSLDLDERTLVLFTSDNGAHLVFGGSNAPLSGTKGSTMEGGMRVPCVVRWPGRIPPRASCDELTSTIDVLPTFAGLAGSGPPADRIIDGKDISTLLFGDPAASTPHDVFYYYAKDELQAVRSGNWKLQLPREVLVRNHKGEPPKLPLLLYDLATDIGETRNLSPGRPEIVARLQSIAEQAREDLGDGDRPGKNQRSPGFVEDPRPLTE